MARRIRTKQKTLLFWCVTMLFGLSLETSYAKYEELNEESSGKVLQYLGREQDSETVVISAGEKEGAVEGALYNVVRPTKVDSQDGKGNVETLWIKTGTLKVIEVDQSYSIAKVLSQETETSKRLFPKYPGIMAGDKVAAYVYKVKPIQQAVPTLTLSYFDLFEDPKRHPQTYEMTPEGKDRIVDLAKPFGNLRMETLLVEAHTDQVGSSSENQIESYQRALTVRQLLIEKLGLDPERVVAIGLGESEPIDQSNVSGFERKNRRVAIKVLPQKPSE